MYGVLSQSPTVLTFGLLINEVLLKREVSFLNLHLSLDYDQKSRPTRVFQKFTVVSRIPSRISGSAVRTRLVKKDLLERYGSVDKWMNPSAYIF